MEIGLYEIGLFLIISGFIVIIAGFILMTRVRGHGGGVLLIGPIPIIWGSDKESLKWLIIISVIFIIFYFLLLFIYGNLIFWR